MTAPNGDVYAVHAQLAQLQSTLTATEQTLNGNIASLMSRIESLMPQWQGLGASAYQHCMTGYQQDQTRMNAALDRLSSLVRTADSRYQSTDQDVTGNFATSR